GPGASKTLSRPRRLSERGGAAQPGAYRSHHAAVFSRRRVAGFAGGIVEIVLFDRDAAFRRRGGSAGARYLHRSRRRHEAASGAPAIPQLQALDANGVGFVVDRGCPRRGDLLRLALIFSHGGKNDESKKPGKNNPALARAFPRERLRVELRRAVGGRANRPVAVQAAGRLRRDRGGGGRPHRAAFRRTAGPPPSPRAERRP